MKDQRTNNQLDPKLFVEDTIDAVRIWGIRAAVNYSVCVKNLLSI